MGKDLMRGEHVEIIAFAIICMLGGDGIVFIRSVVFSILIKSQTKK